MQPFRFAKYVFDTKAQATYLSKEARESFAACVLCGDEISRDLAEEIAKGILKWALELGATHYTHWFLPLSGRMAEKHESLLRLDGEEKPIVQFSSEHLLSGEPDASSFPSGGLRSTFEARGYTRWDPTSPIFVRDFTLYIPSTFYAYTGDALDERAPLLKSMRALSKSGVRLLQLLGNKEATCVFPTLGLEQEFFVLEQSLYEKRPDLRKVSRTLVGAQTTVVQIGESHYCAKLSPEVCNYLKEANQMLWELGVPVETFHNEAAPRQYEMASRFARANVAIDQNQLIMQVLESLAEKHGFVCLFHEKPFTGINGSGKHNNWSLSLDTGENVFEISNVPNNNITFVLFLVAFVIAIDSYQGAMLAAASTYQNDLRLGGYEAPPRVISIYLGEYVRNAVDAFVNGKEWPIASTEIPNQGNVSDRNRTAPIAFTGNKFELRFPGASLSVSLLNTILNTAMAESLDYLSDQLEGAPLDITCVRELVARELERHKRVLFDGNCYDNAWEEEAMHRGLARISYALEAQECLNQSRLLSLLESYGIYSKKEFEALCRVKEKAYYEALFMEAKTLIDLVKDVYLDSAIKYCRDIVEIERVSKHRICKEILANTEESIICLEHFVGRLQKLLVGDCACKEKVEEIRDIMQAIRNCCDTIERIIPRRYLPIPNYSDLLS